MKIYSKISNQAYTLEERLGDIKQGVLSNCFCNLWEFYGSLYGEPELIEVLESLKSALAMFVGWVCHKKN